MWKSSAKSCHIPILVLILIVATSIIYYENVVSVTVSRYLIVGQDFTNSSLHGPIRAIHSQVDVVERVTNLTNRIRSQRIVSEECEIIIRGDRDEISKLRTKRDFPWQETRNDSEVRHLAGNCELLKQRYRFPPYILPIVAAEELDFPIAYSLLAHEGANQILLLLSAIYREHNIHCIHIDEKAPQETYQAMIQAVKCFPNIFVSTVRVNVIYAHVSRLLADIACMKDLLRLPTITYNWKYLINLCSQDFPTRTNLETVRQLKEFRGFNSIGGYLKISDAVRERTLYVWKLSNYSKEGTYGIKLRRTKRKHSPPPHNMTVVKNLAYNFYTRDFLQWALLDSEVGPVLLDWSKDTYSPDEHYWLMLNRHPGAPGGSNLANGYQVARRILWGYGKPKPECHGEWRHGICVLGVEDVSAATKAKDLFINKFDTTLDSTGPTCLRQLLDERSTISVEKRATNNGDKVPNHPPESFFLKQALR